ncbi:MAG: 50S ribosomal protein L18 [Patescibacteria group bacterium]
MGRTKKEKFRQRKLRVRKALKGAGAPRLSLFRSNRFIYAQIIDDTKGKTLASASSKELKEGKTNVLVAGKVGELLAQKARKAKITKVIFDRGGYKYHGQVRALAEGARKGGLDF